jgi:hypothetical protein
MIKANIQITQWRKIIPVDFFASALKNSYKLLLSFLSLLDLLSYFFTAHVTPNFLPSIHCFVAYFSIGFSLK